MSTFKIGDKSLRLVCFRNRKIWFQSEMEEAILASGSEMVTVALKESI
jgi:thiazole synthase ThiGH ThiG subunit